VAELEQQLVQARDDLKRATIARDSMLRELEVARNESATLVDMDTTAINAELAEIDKLNARVRLNQQKAGAEAEASELQEQYDHMTEALETVRRERIELLASVEMPLDGLSIDETGELIYQGQPWDGMSGSEQLMVAAAICAAVKPECGFVLLDKLECMDLDTLFDFGAWLTERGLQAIGTRVSTGDECAIVIEDGMAVGAAEQPAAKPKTTATKKEYRF
jgi:hypothetical protein